MASKKSTSKDKACIAVLLFLSAGFTCVDDKFAGTSKLWFTVQREYKHTVTTIQQPDKTK